MRFSHWGGSAVRRPQALQLHYLRSPPPPSVTTQHASVVLQGLSGGVAALSWEMPTLASAGRERVAPASAGSPGMPVDEKCRG
eukprot:3609630-Rhodomonas_salina.1